MTEAMEPTPRIEMPPGKIEMVPPYPHDQWFYEGPINELFAALALAQSHIAGAEKSATNPYFSSKYADLATVWNAIRGPLTGNGLCVIQQPITEPNAVQLVTVLGHKSGAMIASTFTMPMENRTPQAIGSLVTYMRRYALMAVAGIAPEDDDGNAAQTAANDNAAPPKAANDNKPLSKKESTELRKRLSDELNKLNKIDAIRRWAGANTGVVDHLLPDDKAALANELKHRMKDAGYDE